MEVEGHPIPQDITGFQFKLVGDMTVKQFAFLGAGLLLGWLVFSLPIAILIKGPLAAILAIIGIFFAFAPLNGRSADTMLILFFKALFRPNQFVYKKPQQPTMIPPTPSQLEVPSLPADHTLLQHPHPISSTPPSPVLAVAEPVVTTLPSPVEPEKHPEEKKYDEQILMQQDEKHELTTHSQQAHQKVMELEKQMQELLAQKQELEKQVASLQQHPTKLDPVVTQTVSIPKPEPTQDIGTAIKKDIQSLSVPDTPNLLTGIVKDPRGNVLHNILIEVKDSDNNPVRAFKTNPKGQFASATPLPNGAYTISFEDPKHQQKFDTITLSVNGSILQPLEVTSVDEREELRKSLFQTA